MRTGWQLVCLLVGNIEQERSHQQLLLLTWSQESALLMNSNETKDLAVDNKGGWWMSCNRFIKASTSKRVKHQVHQIMLPWTFITSAVNQCVSQLLLRDKIVDVAVSLKYYQHLCLCSCIINSTMPKHASSNCAWAKKVCHGWSTWGVNVLGHSTDCLVWVRP